jgi:photosystem II stability/assembly factor-like uncharacterized protein
VPQGPVGTYQIAAAAQTAAGGKLTKLAGHASYEELTTSHGSGADGWQSVGPDDQGAVTTAYTSQPGRMFALPNTSPHAGLTRDQAGLPVGGRGVLNSRDGGRSWLNISDGLGNLDVSSLASSPDGQWLYAGTAGGSVYRITTR